MIHNKKINICVLLTFIFFIKSFGQNKTVESYTIENGLSSNWVSCFQLDNEGYLWIGTQNGLDRFDGLKFINYHNKPFENNSLASNWVHNIVKDETGSFWLGTIGGGLQKFNPDKNVFYKDFTVNGEKPTVVRGIVLSNNKIWIASERGLLMASKPYKKFNYISKNYYQDISDLGKEHLILRNKEGVFLLNKRSQNIIRISNQGNQAISEINTDNLYVLENQSISKYKIKDSSINKLRNYKLNLENSNSTLWGSAKLFSSSYGILITSKEKIFRYDSTANILIPILEFSHKSADNTVLNYYETKKGDLWIGTKNGAYHYSNHKETYKKANNGWQNLKDLKVREIQLENNTLWIANETGLKSYHKEQAPITYLKGNITAFKKINDNLFATGKDNYNQAYFWHVNLKTGSKKSFVLENFGAEGIIWKILPSKDKVIIAGQYNFGYYNLKDGTIQFINHLGNIELDALAITDLLIHHNELWIATVDGLFISKNNDLNTLKHFTNDKSTGLTNRIIFDLHKDINQNIWIATEGGLHLYNEKNSSFKHWGKTDGLLDNKVLTIESDSEGMLWIGTNSMGLFKFNPANEFFTHFNKKLGLSSNEFLMSSSFSKNDQIFFGTESEIVTFDAKTLKLPQKDTLQLRIEAIHINKGMDSEMLNQETTNDFILPYNYGNLSFNFNAPNYYNPKSTKYAYKVIGLYDSWVEIGTSNSFSLVNLPHGEYQVQIRAENPLYISSNQSFKLIVKRAFYNTYWAWTLYTLLLVSLLFYFWKQFKNKLIIKNKLENLKEINKLKSKMYAEISHEIKTPLILINGNTSILSKRIISEEQKKAIGAIKKSSKELLSLVNQMLDLVAIDVKRYELQYVTKDIVLFLKQCIALFDSGAKNQSKELLFESSTDSLISNIDVQNLKKVVFNLITNALKFTPKNGKITLELRIPNPDNFEIIVSDTGKGIQPEHLSKVFDRYYKTFDLENNMGSGIGMSLTKEIIQLMEGEIKVESIVNKGTTFTISLPIQKNQDIIKVENNIDLLSSNTSISLHKKEFNLVVVDDNVNLLEYYGQLFDDTYNVKYFQNGKNALHYLKNNHCDFILSDAVMPIMDGFELCKELRKDWTTSHIPLIMVSALSKIENKKEGYKLGIDAFLEKPFEEQELLAVLNNLLSKHQLRASYFKKYFSLENEVSSLLAPKDLDFIEQLHAIVFDRNRNINISILAKELGLSRSQLHRKIKSLAEMSTTDYINNIRIEKAKHLLLNSSLDINEIAYQIGFSDPGYFIKTFKKLSEITPKNWRDTHKKPTSGK